MNNKLERLVKITKREADRTEANYKKACELINVDPETQLPLKPSGVKTKKLR